MNRYRLELDCKRISPAWHYEDVNRRNENSYGWRTIGVDLYERLNLFTFSIDKYSFGKYSWELDWDCKLKRPITFTRIINWWNLFTLYNKPVIALGSDPEQLKEIDELLWLKEDHVFDKTENPIDFWCTNSHRKGHDHLYFVRAGDNVKIGRSKNVRQRISTLSTGIAETPELIFVSDGHGVLEHELHKIFNDLRVREGCEWFRFTDAIKDFIDFAKKN